MTCDCRIVHPFPDGREHTIRYCPLHQAAEELLAALLAAPDFGGKPHTAFGLIYRDWWTKAQTIVAKATGGQP